MAAAASRAVALAMLLPVITGCADGFRAVGANPAAAELRLNQFMGALAVRFTPVEREAKYDQARVKLMKAALVPSRVFDDTSVWTSQPTPMTRLLSIQGMLAESRYRLEARPTLATPARPGDSRHTISLERIGESVFRWDTEVGFAIGSITADDVGAVFSALLAVADGKTESQVRADYRSTFPRAAAAFGRGFSVDSLVMTPSAPGTTSVTLSVGFHPERLGATHPEFAAYLDKYLKPAKYRLTLADRSGAVMFDLIGRDRVLTFKYRVSRGKLVALTGAPVPLGDTLRLTAEVKLKVKVFTIGFHELVTDFAITHAPHERAWTVISQREPKWDLPLVTERLIRASLHRPFEGPGALFRLSVRDTVGGQTQFIRRTRLDVQESAIMRFVGSLGAHMMGELSSSVEVEEQRFLKDAFAALVADIRALGVRPARTEIENATER